MSNAVLIFTWAEITNPGTGFLAGPWSAVGQSNEAGRGSGDGERGGYGGYGQTHGSGRSLGSPSSDGGVLLWPSDGSLTGTNASPYRRGQESPRRAAFGLSRGAGFGSPRGGAQ